MFEEERNCASSCRGNSAGCPHGRWHNQGQGNYESNKLGVTNTAHVNCNGIKCFDGVWMAFCSKRQAMIGAPIIHTTGFHDVALLAGSSYCLPSTHPFDHHCSTTPSFNSTGNGTSTPVLNSAALVLKGEVAASNGFICKYPRQRSSSPSQLSDCHSWCRYCSSCLRPWRSIWVTLVGHNISDCYVPCLQKSRPTFYSDSGWLHWDNLLCLFDYFVPTMSFQATNELPTRAILSSSISQIHHQSTIITFLPT